MLGDSDDDRLVVGRSVDRRHLEVERGQLRLERVFDGVRRREEREERTLYVPAGSPPATSALRTPLFAAALNPEGRIGISTPLRAIATARTLEERKLLRVGHRGRGERVDRLDNDVRVAFSRPRVSLCAVI